MNRLQIICRSLLVALVLAPVQAQEESIAEIAALGVCGETIFEEACEIC